MIRATGDSTYTTTDTAPHAAAPASTSQSTPNASARDPLGGSSRNASRCRGRVDQVIASCGQGRFLREKHARGTEHCDVFEADACRHGVLGDRYALLIRMRVGRHARRVGMMGRATVRVIYG